MSTAVANMPDDPKLGEFECRVLTADSKGATRRLSVVDARGSQLVLYAQRFALVSPDDIIYINPENPKLLSVRSRSTSQLIHVTPHFEKFDSWLIGASSYKIKIHEIKNDQELQDYQYLESFHYRSTTAVEDQKSDDNAQERGSQPTTGGRKAVLLLSLNLGGRWNSVGYIELQMPLQMVKPRHLLFNAHYQNPSDDTQWSEWQSDSIRKHVNRIVRIARLVISPEHRGLGFSKVLIESAIDFARQRWHIGGKKPLFIEISAEMLRYIDFVSGCGFHFAGETEGNLSRVAKDLKYMYRNYAADTGIMTLQKSYLTKFIQGSKILKKTFEEMLLKLESITNDPSKISSLDPGEYHVFKQVIRFPRPYFVRGLDEYSDEFVRKRVAEIAVSRLSPVRGSPRVRGEIGRIKAVGLRIRFVLLPQSSKNVQIIKDCFGLSSDSLESIAIKNASFEASPGNILFVSGSSGSGKSALLSALDPKRQAQNIEITYSRFESCSSVGWMADLPEDVPIIEYFSDRWGMEAALSALSEAGLAEAFAYIKNYGSLSRGQQYRARLADLNLRGSQLWLLDEFCADLDPITAKIVSHNLRRHVIRHKKIAVVAAANHAHFIDALRPTRVLRLRQGFDAEFLTYQEFKNEF